MKRPSFLHGAGVALLASFSGGVLFSVLSGPLPSELVLRGVIAALGLVYTMYLLIHSDERVGRVTTVLLWSVMFTVSWLGAPSLLLYVLMHVGSLWLVRSLYYYTSLLSALLDLSLCAMSLTTALWAAAHTGNIFLAIWCFFVGQALFVGIPASMRRQEQPVDSELSDHTIFQRAHRTAEAALRRLSVNH
jgi:hypothetical protein